MALEFIDKNVEIDSRHYVRELSIERIRQVRDAIRAAGLRASDCKWGWTHPPSYDNYYLPMLEHAPTESFFVFGGSVYNPGRPVQSGATEDFFSWIRPGASYDREQSRQNSWGDQLAECRLWLIRVKAFHDEPNLWTDEGEAPTFNAPVRWIGEDSPFTSIEQQRLAEALEETKSQLLATAEKQAATAESMEQIGRDFAELKDDLTRLGRKTWFHKFRSMLVEAIIAAGAKELVIQIGDMAAKTIYAALMVVDQTLPRLP